MEKIIKGYVLKLTPYKENDCIVNVLNKDTGSFVSFKARGILKNASKNSPSCQPYTLGEFVLNYSSDNSANHTLKTGVILDCIQGIYEKIEVNAILGLLTEGLIKLEESIENEERIELYETVFNALKTEHNYKTIILVLLKYFMLYSGVIMDADGCVICGRKDQIVDVSYKEGGLICYSCNNHHDPHKDALYIKNYRYVIKSDVKNIYDFEVPDIIAIQLIRDFFEYLENSTGLKFKSRSVINAVL